MKVAIDRTLIKKIDELPEYDYIYIFDDEPLDELIKLGIHCMHKDYANEIDVNLTDYDINCFKNAKVTDKNWDVLATKEYKYAIIVPNYNNDHGEYNGKTYFQNCIESVLNQTYNNFELIIVDDMSTDTSVETVEKYVDKRIHLIKNIRKRYNGGSRNVGIEYAKTTDADYICFLDSDDWWLHNEVLEHINRKLYNHEMMILGAQMLFTNGSTFETYNKFDNYEDVFFCIDKVWCTAWSRVIRKDKIAFFCEDTLMEDRVWSYKQADNCNFNKIINLNEIVYCWNRLNTSNSVSLTRNEIWDASAWCHIGHQKQFLKNLKHTEMKNKLQKRIDECIKKIKKNEYQQY